MQVYEGDSRKERLAKVKKGSGTFVYDGSAADTSYVPTILLTGDKEPVIGENGLPVLDGAGRQVYKPRGLPVLNDDGTPKLGGVPKVETKAIETYQLWGVEFPKGKRVEVKDPKLALKLRLLSCFEEVESKPVGRPKAVKE